MGAGLWTEVPALMPGNSLVGWAQRYERELPLRKADRRLGTSRKWAPRSMQLREERQSNKVLSSRESPGKNIFAPLAAAFMLPIMRDYDKRAHGVDFLESGFIVLGKILYTLGVCMECITAQPEALVLGANLLELLRSRYYHLSLTYKLLFLLYMVKFYVIHRVMTVCDSMVYLYLQGGCKPSRSVC